MELRPNLFRLPLNYFNLTMTYRKDSDFWRFYDRPVPNSVMNGPAYDWEAVKSIVLNKTKGIFKVFSKCRTPGKRELYIKQLKRHLKIDIFGKCGKRRCNSECFEKNLKDYKFYLALENSVCDEYITEKFYRVKKLIVPIVFRERDYLNVLPKGSFIALDQFR